MYTTLIGGTVDFIAVPGMPEPREWWRGNCSVEEAPVGRTGPAAAAVFAAWRAAGCPEGAAEITLPADSPAHSGGYPWEGAKRLRTVFRLKAVRYYPTAAAWWAANDPDCHCSGFPASEISSAWGDV